MRRRSLAPIAILITAVALASMARGRAQGSPTLGTAELRRALDDFQAALDYRWSYRHANRADFGAAIAALREKTAGGMTVDEFGLELHKIVALGIDGHSGVTGHQLPGTRYLPFLIEPVGDRFVAFTPERTAFPVDRFPYVTKIDGRDIDDWCRAAAVIVPKGSPQYIRHRCLVRMRNLDFVRALMNLPQRDTVDVELLSADGRTRRTVTLAAARTLPAYGVWPRGGSRLIGNNIGYLRLTSMVKASTDAEIAPWMPQFRDTIGLIVDVRDNDGGDRDALRLLYSYFAAPADPPRVFTAAAYRLHPAHLEDHLVRAHRMFPGGAGKWTTAERNAIAAFARSFEPEWKLPPGQFSDWHYMVLNRLDLPETYHYDKPVVILMNEKCFSATDIFLAGLKGMRNVTLLGTPSSGGSAHTQEVVLGSTPLRLRIGSMASFQRDGKLFDRNGVRPDVVVAATPEFYIGGADNVLAEAMKRLGAK